MFPPKTLINSLSLSRNREDLLEYSLVMPWAGLETRLHPKPFANPTV